MRSNQREGQQIFNSPIKSRRNIWTAFACSKRIFFKRFGDTNTIFLQDSSNLDMNLLTPLLINSEKRIYSDQMIQRHLIKRNEPLQMQFRERKEIMLLRVYGQQDDLLEKELELEMAMPFCIPSHSVWHDCVIYFAFPILSVEFAPRQPKQDIIDKSSNRNLDQYLAVALQLNSYQDTKNQEDLTQKTIASFNLSSFHRQGWVYPGKGVLAIVKIPIQEEAHDFAQPTIEYYLTSENGCITLIKWCPKFSTSEKEIGLLGMVTSMGHFQIASIANHSNIKDGSFIENNIIQTIQMDGMLFSSFDWVTSSENDLIGLGDQSGNVFVIKINLLLNSFDIISYLPNLHISEVTTMEFYLHNDQVCPLLATGSYDGNVKVLDPLQSCEPIFDLNLSAGIISLKWDYGGKFLNVIRDDLVNRAVLLSFFSIEKAVKNKDVGYTLQNLIEQRYLANLAGSELTLKQSMSFYHDQIYFSSITGKIYQSQIENIRKLAIKKEKKSSQQAKILSQTDFELKNGQLVVSLKYNSQDLKKEIKQEENESIGVTKKNEVFRYQLQVQMTNRLSGFQLLSLSPNNFEIMNLHQNKECISGLLACASHLGVLRINKILKSQEDK